MRVLDEKCLNQLRDLENRDNPGFLRRILSAYLVESEQIMARLKAHAQTGDFATVARLAHALKSSSAAIGAHSFAELSQCLERCAGAAAFTKEWRQMESEFQKVQSDIHTILKSG